MPVSNAEFDQDDRSARPRKMSGRVPRTRDFQGTMDSLTWMSINIFKTEASFLLISKAKAVPESLLLL